ncbi:swr complex subunit [Elasticomyces elasticus]|nr:swr complex subunit [Elasticomyces elasticus]
MAGATGRDMRDMLGLPTEVDAPRPPPLKKQKTAEKRTAERGMAREVSALMGERAPPVAVIQTKPKYKSKSQRLQKVGKWEWAPFGNQARQDGLILKHWSKRKEAKTRPKPLEGTDGVTTPTEADGDTRTEASAPEAPYKFARYNVQVERPSYTEEVYTNHLQKDGWSKEETDYLMDLVSEYYQKWPVVHDRYEFRPSDHSDQPKARSLEDLKARYYYVSAILLRLTTPISSMNTAQYSLYETLTNFNPAEESSRKNLAAGHLTRTALEAQEEELLLKELQRIMLSQKQMEVERRDIRDRLGYPPSTNAGIAMQYNTSAALAILYQNLLAADKNKRNQRMRHTNEPANTPASAQAPQPASAGGRDGSASHRDSLSNATTTPAGRPSRASLPGPTGTANDLTPAEKARFLISPPEKAGSSISFGSDRLHRLRTMKSTTQTQKVGAVLTQLNIPETLHVPSQRVADEFEKLVGRIGILLDLRKNREKEENEIAIRSAEKQLKSGTAAGTEGGERDESRVESSAPATSEGRRSSAQQIKLEGGDGGNRGVRKRSASLTSETSGRSTSFKPLALDTTFALKLDWFEAMILTLAQSVEDAQIARKNLVF